MDFMGTDLIDNLQEGELFALSSSLGGVYHAQRFSGRSIWEFPLQGDGTSVNAAAVVELLKSECGNYAGFRSHHAEGKILQACRDKQNFLRFNNYNFDKWEQWSIYGNSLDKCLLVNRKFTDKQFEASFHKILMVTELSLDRFLEKLKVKVKNVITKGFGGKAEEQLHEFPSQVQHSRPNTDGDASFSSSSKLYEILHAFFTSTIVELENELISVEHTLIEKQAMEYDNKLNSVQKKAQDLESRLLHVQESTMTYRKEADKKIAVLLNDLELAQLSAKCAAADQSRLKLIEAEATQLSDELHSINSCVNEMKLRNKLAEEKAQKFALEATKSHERVCELEMFFLDAQLNLQNAEEKILVQDVQHKEEVKLMMSKEETLKEAQRKADEELEMTRKRVSELEHELSLAATREEEQFRQPKLKREQTAQSLVKLMDSQNIVEDANTKKHSSILASSIQNEMLTQGAERDGRFNGVTIPRDNYQKFCVSGEKSIRDIEAELNDAKLFIEKCEKRSEAGDEKEGMKIATKLKNSDDESKSNGEHMMSLQRELDKLKSGSFSIADSFKEAGVKAAGLKLTFTDQEAAFNQKCQGLENAVMYLSEKLLKLENSYNTAQLEVQFTNNKVKVLEINREKLEIIIIKLKEKITAAEAYSLDVLTSNKSLTNRLAELQGFLKRKEAENEEAANYIMELKANLSQARHESFTLESVIKSLDEIWSTMDNTIQQMSKRLLDASEEKVEQLEESLGQIENTLKQSDDRSAAELEQLVHKVIDIKLLDESSLCKALTTGKEPPDLAGKLENVESSLLYHKKVLNQSMKRFRELESLIMASNMETKIATEKASYTERLLVAAERNYSESDTKVTDLTKELIHLDGEFEKVKIEADVAAAQLEEAEKRIAEMLQLTDKLTKAELLILHLKEKVSLAEGRACKAEANLHESSVKTSTLRIELCNNEEVIKNLQVSLAEVEDHRHTLGAQIENVTRSFAELNKQLEHERQHLHVQVGRMRQRNDSLKGENGRLQEQLQEALSDAKACGKKLKESLLWNAVLEKEVHNLKLQMKKSKTKSNFSDFFESPKERDLNVDSGSVKSMRRKHKDTVVEVQRYFSALQKVNGKKVHPQCSSIRSWMVLCLCTFLCTCFMIKIWLVS